MWAIDLEWQPVSASEQVLELEDLELETLIGFLFESNVWYFSH